MLHKEELHNSLSSPDTANLLIIVSFVLAQLLCSISNLYSIGSVSSPFVCVCVCVCVKTGKGM